MEQDDLEIVRRLFDNLLNVLTALDTGGGGVTRGEGPCMWWGNVRAGTHQVEYALEIEHSGQLFQPQPAAVIAVLLPPYPRAHAGSTVGTFSSPRARCA